MSAARLAPWLIAAVACTSHRPAPLGRDASEGGGAPSSDVSDAEAPDGAPPPVAKGTRVLGVAVRIDDVDLPDQVAAIREAGATSTNVTFAWDDVERPVDGGTSAPYHPGVHIAGLVLSGAGLGATVALDALDAAGERLPESLAGRSLDDPELSERYAAATDYVLSQLPDLAMSDYLVGTDVDAALGDDLAAYGAFAVFVERAAAHVHAARPGVRVGFAVTSGGLVARSALLAGALAKVDVVGVTRLGVGPLDLDGIAAAAPPGKVLLVHAAGHPSSPDEGAQASFARGAFAAWDRHADRIPILTFFELDDPTSGATTYGLRRRPGGQQKPAFGALRAEARTRGF